MYFISVLMALSLLKYKMTVTQFTDVIDMLGILL